MDEAILVQAWLDYEKSLGLEEGINCCQVSHWVLSRLNRGQLYGYFSTENPSARVGQVEGGHRFLLVDDFIVDFWWRDFYEVDFPLYLKKDTPLAKELYGDPNCWTLVPHSHQ